MDFDNILSIDENGLIVKSTDVDIQTIVTEDIIKKTYENPNIDESSVFGQQIKIYSQLISKMESDLIYVLNLLSIRHTANLDFTANRLGFIRKNGLPTQVNLSFLGLAGNTIPNGTICEDEEGYQYITENDLILDGNGEGTVLAFCSTAGAINPQINTITKIVTELVNVDSVTNNEEAVVGSDEENDVQFLQRILSVNQVNSGVIGTLDAIKRAIFDLDGVIDVYGVENISDSSKTIGNLTLDPHSISLVVNGGTLDEIAKAIKEKKNVGCGTTGNITASYVYNENGITYIDNYLIYRPSVVNFYFKLTYSKNINTPNNIENIIKQYILQYQQENPFKLGTTIFATDFVKALSSILYQFSISNLQVKKNVLDEYTSFIEMQEQEFGVLLENNIILEEVL